MLKDGSSAKLAVNTIQVTLIGANYHRFRRNTFGRNVATTFAENRCRRDVGKHFN